MQYNTQPQLVQWVYVETRSRGKFTPKKIKRMAVYSWCHQLFFFAKTSSSTSCCEIDRMHRIFRNIQRALVIGKVISFYTTTQDFTFQGLLWINYRRWVTKFNHTLFSRSVSNQFSSFFGIWTTVFIGKFLKIMYMWICIIRFHLRVQNFSVLELKNWFRIGKSVLKINVNIFNKIFLVV